MADLSARVILFPVVFIGLFAFLMLYMPADFLIGDIDYESKDYPSVFTAQDIAQYKFFDNLTLAYGSYNQLIELGTETQGYCKFLVHWYTHWQGVNSSWLKLEYVTWEVYIFGIPVRTTESCTWRGHITPEMEILPTYLSKTDLQQNCYANESYGRFSASSRSSPTVEVWLSDSNETRDNVLSAWSDEEMIFTIAMGIDEFSSTLSSYDTLVRLLTFQEIQAIPIWVSYPINLFIWGLTAYGIYNLIIKIIPLVGS